MIQTRTVAYRGRDVDYRGELFLEAGTGKRPGVVVFPEAFGLNDHARSRARRLAERGYAALAADLHGGGQVFDDMERLRPRMEALFGDRAAWRAMARAAWEALLAQPEVDGGCTAAIGFCFGGATCLELARSGAPLKAIATFHAGLLPELPEDAGRIRCSVLICHGDEDPLVSREVIDAVMAEWRRDRVDWEFIHFVGAAHSFTNPDAASRGMPGLAYHPKADARSWAAMCRLFDEVFGEGEGGR